ncbi:MAG: hypothetical protein ACLPVF_03355 [Acidimicrobiales bacterium]
MTVETAVTAMAVFEALVFVTMGGWILFEISLVVRDRRLGTGSAEADRGTRLLNAFLVVETVVVSGVLAATLPVLGIEVEESELERVLGEPYLAYSARTRRLVPGIR